MKFLEFLNKLSFVIGVVLLLIAVNLLSSINKQKSDFYEYEGKKINLSMVKHVIPRVDYVITYKEDKEEDIFRKYSTSLNEKEMKNIESFLKLAKESKFYSVEIVAYMMFDSEKIKLYHSPHYLKEASEYVVGNDFLNTLKLHGLDSFQYENLAKIKDIIYKDKEKFLEDVLAYAKLKDSEWMRQNIEELARDTKANVFMKNINNGAENKELNADDVETITDSLQEAYSKYLGIK